MNRPGVSGELVNRGRKVLGNAIRRDADADAAVRAWLTERSDQARRLAIAALEALDES